MTLRFVTNACNQLNVMIVQNPSKLLNQGYNICLINFNISQSHNKKESDIIM